MRPRFGFTAPEVFVSIAMVAIVAVIAVANTSVRVATARDTTQIVTCGTQTDTMDDVRLVDITAATIRVTFDNGRAPRQYAGTCQPRRLTRRR